MFDMRSATSGTLTIYGYASTSVGLNVQGHISADHRITALVLYNSARKRGVAHLR
jgi:hypothetical protein